jgi:hypothetical protein
LHREEHDQVAQLRFKLNRNHFLAAESFYLSWSRRMSFHLESVSWLRPAGLSHETSGPAGRSRWGGIHRNSGFSFGDEPCGSPFERGEIAQALIDSLCVIVGIPLLCMIAARGPVCLFVLFFVGL